MLKPSARIPIVTFIVFLLAIFVSLMFKSAKPFFLGMPFALVFDISCSFFLCIYYYVEASILLKS